MLKSKMPKPKILFILTGSIACYKACQVISKLVQAGCEVKTVASQAALSFIGRATLEGLSGNQVSTDTFTEGHMMEHIHLERWADLILVAPATGNFINKIAAGISDDLGSTILLAHDFKKPVLLAPAMNTFMYLNPATQEATKKLSARGIQILEAESGVLACGEVGWGRLLEPEPMAQRVLSALAAVAANEATPDRSFDLATAGKNIRVVVTAGGTAEPIDSVRAITNTSTGRTGVQIAESIAQAGFDVELLLAEGAAVSSWIANQRRFSSFASLSELAESSLSKNPAAVFIHCAAVSDFSVDHGSRKPEQKISTENLNEGETISLVLKKNPKIISSLKKWNHKPLYLVGFKLTVGLTDTETKRKVGLLFENSSCDLVIQNDLQETGQKQRRLHVFRKSELGIAKANSFEAVGQLCQYLISEIIKQTNPSKKQEIL